MRDGVYKRRWRTNSGQTRERFYVVCNDRALKLSQPGDGYRAVSTWAGRLGEWVWWREARTSELTMKGAL